VRGNRRKERLGEEPGASPSGGGGGLDSGSDGEGVRGQGNIFWKRKWQDPLCI
jgi:hypothetical protein